MSESTSATPTLPEIIRAQVGRVLDGMRAAMPGRVTSYDAATQECSVQPLLKVSRTNDVGEQILDTLPVIDRVPVVFPGAGAYSITFPIAAGDTVLLVFADQSLDEWLVNDGIVDPKSTRRSHITDAIAIPGLRSFRNAKSNVPTDCVCIEGAVKLGSHTATRGVARDGDDVDLTTAGALALQTVLDTRYTVANPLTNLTGATIGEISSASSAVKSI